MFSVLVGAPKGNSSYKPGVVNPGVLYECSFWKKTCLEHDANKYEIAGNVADECTIRELSVYQLIFILIARTMSCDESQLALCSLGKTALYLFKHCT